MSSEGFTREDAAKHARRRKADEGERTMKRKDGPLRVERSPDEGGIYPYELWCGALYMAPISTEQADAIEAQLVGGGPDLPEGVFVAPDGRLLATFDVARALCYQPQREGQRWTAHLTGSAIEVIGWSMAGSVIVEVRPPVPHATVTVELPVDVVRVIADDEELWGTETCDLLHAACRAALAEDDQ